MWPAPPHPRQQPRTILQHPELSRRTSPRLPTGRCRTSPLRTPPHIIFILQLVWCEPNTRELAGGKNRWPPTDGDQEPPLAPARGGEAALLCATGPQAAAGTHNGGKKINKIKISLPAQIHVNVIQRSAAAERNPQLAGSAQSWGNAARKRFWSMNHQTQLFVPLGGALGEGSRTGSAWQRARCWAAGAGL